MSRDECQKRCLFGTFRSAGEGAIDAAKGQMGGVRGGVARIFGRDAHEALVDEHVVKVPQQQSEGLRKSRQRSELQAYYHSYTPLFT